MNMKDAETGEELWSSPMDWLPNLHTHARPSPPRCERFFDDELDAHVPARILECKEVSREVTFFSEEALNDFKIQQIILFQGVAIEGPPPPSAQLNA
jgi:hypothetical protein